MQPWTWTVCVLKDTQGTRTPAETMGGQGSRYACHFFSFPYLIVFPHHHSSPMPSPTPPQPMSSSDGGG